MNIPISLDTAIAIHDLSILKFGGSEGIRDMALLEAALAQPFQSAGGVDLYPSDVEKAARIAFEIISNHPFIDGNKRTGTALMGMYLRMNNIDFHPKPDQLLNTMLLLASGSIGYEGILLWLKNVCC